MINIETAKKALLSYLDKCEKGSTYNTSPINMDRFIFSDTHGKSYNIATATAYIARYAANDGAKAGNKEDIFKAIHFLLFEIERQEGYNIYKDVDNCEHKEDEPNDKKYLPF